MISKKKTLFDGPEKFKLKSRKWPQKFKWMDLKSSIWRGKPCFSIEKRDKIFFAAFGGDFFFLTEKFKFDSESRPEKFKWAGQPSFSMKKGSKKTVRLRRRFFFFLDLKSLSSILKVDLKSSCFQKYFPRSKKTDA